MCDRFYGGGGLFAAPIREQPKKPHPKYGWHQVSEAVLSKMVENWPRDSEITVKKCI